MTAESPRLGGRVGSPGRPQILELIEERRRVGGWSSVALFCNQMVVKLPPPPPIPPPSLLFTVNDSSADEAVSGAAGQKHHGEKGLCNWTRRHFFFPCFCEKEKCAEVSLSHLRHETEISGDSAFPLN